MHLCIICESNVCTPSQIILRLSSGIKNFYDWGTKISYFLVRNKKPVASILGIPVAEDRKLNRKLDNIFSDKTKP